MWRAALRRSVFLQRNVHSKPSPAPDLLRLASLQATDYAPADALNELRPQQIPTMPAELDALKAKIDKGFTRPQLIAYLIAHAPVDELAKYMPRGGASTANVASATRSLRKPALVDALVHSAWALPTPRQMVSDLNANDPVLARVQQIDDNDFGRLELPCTDRDMFFVHGHGETVRRLMLQGNVQIELDTDGRQIIIRGNGKGIKKTVKNIRNLLQYKETYMTVPLEAKHSHRNFTLTNHFVRKIMRQCNLYIEERGDKLLITATNLVSLSLAKQLIRSVWDLFQDTRWHVVQAVGNSTRNEKPIYAFLPFLDPHWSENRLLDGVACWKVAPLDQNPPPHTGQAELSRSLVLAPPPSVIPEPPRDAIPVTDTDAVLETHRRTLEHYLAQFAPPPGAVDVELSIGTLAFFTPQSFGLRSAGALPETAGAAGGDAEAPPAATTLFSAPLGDAFAPAQLQAWAATEQPAAVFHPTARHSLDLTKTSDEVEAEAQFHLALQAAKRKKTKYAAVKRIDRAAMAKSVAAAEAERGNAAAAGSAGATRRSKLWRVVFTADSTFGSEHPGKPELVVDVEVPPFDEEGPLTLREAMVRQVALTVDTILLDKSQALRSNVVLRRPADVDLSTFLADVVVPTMVRAEGKVYSPPSFVYEGREYTFKWIGRVVTTKESVPLSSGDDASNSAARKPAAAAEAGGAMQSVHVQHRFAEANDGTQMRTSMLVAADVKPQWVVDRANWAAMVQRATRD